MSLAGASFSVFRTSVLIQIGQLLAAAVIARSLGPSQMGLWFLLIMVLNYAEMLGRPHVDEAAVYFMGKGRYPPGQVAFSVILVALISSGFVMAFFAFLREWLFATFLHSLAAQRAVVYWMVLSTPLSFLAIGYGYLFLGRGEVGAYNVLRLITALLPWAAGAAIVELLAFGLPALVAAQVISGLIGVSYAAARLRRVVPLVLRVELHLLWQMLVFGAKLYAVAATSYLNIYVSSALVALHLSAEHVAFYRLAQTLALTIAKLPESVGTVLYPRIAAMTDAAGRSAELTGRSVRISLVALGVLALLGMILARPIVLAVYGQAFQPVIAPLVILLPGVAAFVSTGLVKQHFTGRGRPSLTLLLTLIPMLGQLWMLHLAIPRFAVAGAAAATSAAWLLASAVHIWAFVFAEGVPVAGLIAVSRADVGILTDTVRSVSQQALVAVRKGVRSRKWKTMGS